VLSGLWDKIGVAWDGVQAGENAGIWSANRAFSAANWQRLDKRLDATYADFTAKVAKGRGMTDEEVRKVAKGQVWTGEDAVALGLVDELGGFRRAVELAAETADAAPDEVRLKRFPKARDPFEAVIEDTLGSALDSPGMRSLVRGLGRLARALAPLVEATEQLRADPRSRSLMAPELRPAG
jgi:protease-4